MSPATACHTCQRTVQTRLWEVAGLQLYYIITYTQQHLRNLIEKGQVMGKTELFRPNFNLAEVNGSFARNTENHGIFSKYQYWTPGPWVLEGHSPALSQQWSEREYAWCSFHSQVICMLMSQERRFCMEVSQWVKAWMRQAWQSINIVQLMLTHGKGWKQQDDDPGLLYFVYPELSPSKRAVKLLTF